MKLQFSNRILLILVFSVVLHFSCNRTEKNEFASVPFEGLDTLSTKDWWNRGENPIINLHVSRDQTLAFGIYTVSDHTLKLTAQLYPLYPEESRVVTLAFMENGQWVSTQKQSINELGWTAHFRVENWDDSQSVRYRLMHGDNATYEGLIRKNPINQKEITLAALSCNSNKDRGNRNNYVRNIEYLNPDLIFFAGDQSYDHTEHTAAWLKFGLQFRELFRNRPAVTIPDDHDIGQGNLWGEGGKKAERKQGDDGGYYYDVDYVNMVERCQTWHLPDPVSKIPLQRGMHSYYTHLNLGGVDFAIIEDRKFKSGPNGKIPQQGPRADHINNPNYNPESIDLPELTLLGEQQLGFLDAWADEPGEMKAVLSATGFCGGAHIHGNIENRLHADLDSNGWPQTGRNKALHAIKKANAVHIAGDQHLATVIQHGVDAFNDGPWAFVVPAIVNNYYSRWWWPENEQPGNNSNDILPWTGEYLDGFNNKITMHAYVNPDSNSNGAGFGFIRFKKETKEVAFECWPRYEDVTKKEAKQFPGWPITIGL